MEDKLVTQYAGFLSEEILRTIEKRQCLHIQDLRQLLVAELRQAIDSDGSCKLL